MDSTTWYELSLEMGLLGAVNEYIAMNGDIEVEELMDVFGVGENEAGEIISQLTCQYILISLYIYICISVYTKSDKQRLGMVGSVGRCGVCDKGMTQ